MAMIPLGTDDVESKDENAARIRLENMYLVDSPYSPDGISRVSRPTLTLDKTFPGGSIWGMFQQDGVFDGLGFVVSGNSLYSYDFLEEPVEIGVIPGVGFVQIVGGSLATGSRLLLLREGKVYSWNGQNITNVNIPDSDNIGSMCYLDGFYFLSVINNPDKIGRFYWISPGLVDPDALDFATAERSPDGLMSVSVVGDELWLIGNTSTEVWAPSGNPDAPFQRIPGRPYTYGCHSPLTTVSSNYQGNPCLLWVTDTKIVIMAQGQPQKVSNDSIDELLRTSTNIRAWGFQYNRHNFYVLTCEEVTLVYDLTKNSWSRWSSYQKDNFRGHLGFQVSEKVYAGDITTGNVYELTEGSDDDGDPVVRTVSGLVIFQGNYLNCSRVNVVMNAGWSPSYTGPATLEIRWSDDLGYSWGNYFPVSIGDKGAYRSDVTLSGLGMIRRPGRLFQFRFSDKTRFRIDYATMNEM